MDIHEEKNKSQHKAGINWKKAKHYLFCCIPFFSNEFLERLTFWDWAPMIVGHPGESEADFQELLDFVRDARFERLGAFTYSEEEGTFDATHFKDDIPQQEKDRRLDVLMNLQREISLEYNNSRVGTVVDVLVDDIVDGTLVCRSEFESPEVDGEILVKDAAGDVKVGDMIKVRIVAADDYDLAAERVI